MKKVLTKKTFTKVSIDTSEASSGVNRKFYDSITTEFRNTFENPSIFCVEANGGWIHAICRALLLKSNLIWTGTGRFSFSINAATISGMTRVYHFLTEPDVLFLKKLM